MIGIKWDYNDFVSALNKISGTRYDYMTINQLFSILMEQAIWKIFRNNLQGEEVEIIREAWNCNFNHGEFPSQCFMSNNQIIYEGNEYSEGDLTIQVLNQGINCGRHLVKFWFNDRPEEFRVTWMNMVEIDGMLKDHE